MDNNNQEKNKWINGFQEFLSVDTTEIPKSLSKKTFSTISELLNPSPLLVFAKLSVIHLIVGCTTLLFCPQFGLSLTSGMGLMHYFMMFGKEACTLGCGAFFVGTSLLAASLILKPEEIKVLRRGKIIQLTSLCALSFITFSSFGGEVIMGLALVWMLGAILGGAATLEFGNWFRKTVFAQ